MKISKTLSGPILLALVVGCGGSDPGAGADSIPEPPDVDVPDPAEGDDPETEKVISFTADVLPILQASCVGCHGQAGGLSLESHDSVLAGAEGGPVIVGGDPDASDLVLYVDGTKEPRMPKGADPLTDEQIGTIRTWILQGAAGD
jgi:mono/diheme cytochrome c family protein